ncbi:MAG: helix-turn-helix domain-containing protein, partial [Muribaculaceae bacterium]
HEVLEISTSQFKYFRMKNDINIKFGKRVIELRKTKGITQEELAYGCDIQRSYMGVIERGEKSVTLNTIEKIAAGLEISIIELMSF